MRDVGKMIVENFNDLDETQLPTFPRLILQETLSETECTDHCTKPIHTIPALNNKIQVLFQRKIYIESTKTLREMGKERLKSASASNGKGGSSANVYI